MFLFSNKKVINILPVFEKFIQKFYINLLIIPVIPNKNIRTWFEYGEDVTQYTGVFMFNNKEFIAVGVLVGVLIFLRGGSPPPPSPGRAPEIFGDVGLPFGNLDTFATLTEVTPEVSQLLFRIIGGGAAGLALAWNYNGWGDLAELRDLNLSEIKALENLTEILFQQNPLLKSELHEYSSEFDFKFLGEYSGILDSRRPGSSRRVLQTLRDIYEAHGENVSFNTIKTNVQFLSIREQHQLLVFHKLLMLLYK